MNFRLRSDLYHCVVDGRTIFFDLGRGRYFALPRRLDKAFERVVSMAGRFDDIERLVSCGVLERTKEHGAKVVPPSIPSASGDRLPFVEGVEPSTRTVIKVIVTQTLVALFLKTLPVRVVFRILCRPGACEGPTSAGLPDRGRVDQLAAAFRIAGLILKSDGQCLPRTLAFQWLCRREGLSATLVIGVRVNPFLAHCWCQEGGTVLNDTLETTSLFQPIFAT